MGARSLIAFSAQLSDGVGLPAVLTLSVGVGPLCVVIASFISHGARWELGTFDLACGALSVLALVLWALSGSGTVAIGMSIAADALAAAPTVLKAYRRPETEHHVVFRNSAVNGAITLLTIDHWTFASWGFPVYIMLVGITLWTLISLRIGPRLRAHRRATHTPFDRGRATG